MARDGSGWLGMARDRPDALDGLEWRARASARAPCARTAGPGRILRRRRKTVSHTKNVNSEPPRYAN
eukprot:6374962-Prymnesium_polylepis.1